MRTSFAQNSYPKGLYLGKEYGGGKAAMLICQKSPLTILISSPSASLEFYPLEHGLMVSDSISGGLGLRHLSTSWNKH